MPSASIFLIVGILSAVALSTGAWIWSRLPRSPSRSVREFQHALRALNPNDTRRG